MEEFIDHLGEQDLLKEVRGYISYYFSTYM
jgi:hypothetical protein